MDRGNWDNALTFEYHYRVLPSSIFSRFMVRVHEQISQKTYWRNGVVLHYEGCKALVRSDREDKTITMVIIGNKNRRRGFLSSRRLQFGSWGENLFCGRVRGKSRLKTITRWF